MIRALHQRFENVYVLANRKFAGLSLSSSETSATLALDSADLAPFFVRKGELPAHWRDLFSRQDLILSYLHDPAEIFEENVRSCGAKRFLVGPHQLNGNSHATEQLARPLPQLGIPFLETEPRLDFLPADSVTSSTIVLHPGSGSRRKNWAIDNWGALTRELLARERRVVVAGGEADLDEIARLRQCFGQRIDYAIDWPLRRLALFLAQVAFIGHDSGISHLAAAAGAQCLILFGPTDPKIWAPRNRSVRVLAAPGGDLRQLTVRTVSDALGMTGPQELMRIGIKT